MNVDTANNASPIAGKIIMSNLCSEIMQVQTPSVLNNRQEYDVLGTDVSCNLGSTNIPNLMQSPDFEKIRRCDGACFDLRHRPLGHRRGAIGAKW